MSDEISVNTDVIDAAAADATVAATAIDEALSSLASGVRELGVHWLGDASDAHASSHALWKTDALAYQAALTKLATALSTTSTNYTATENAIESTWL